jgi:transposase-like protein
MDTNENNVLGRASYTEAERRELIEEFHSSGLTQAAFAREWQINPKTLARWLKIEREEIEVSFCEVEIQANAPAVEGELRFCLPNGIEALLSFKSLNQLGGFLREVAGCLD